MNTAQKCTNFETKHLNRRTISAQDKAAHAQSAAQRELEQQGRKHGNPVADSWAGAVMRKPLGIQKCDGRTNLPTYRPTRQGVESRVRD